jgi:hypothetical protein
MIPLEMLPDLVRDLLDLIEAIKNDGWALRSAEDDGIDRIGKIIDEIRQTL